MKVLEIGYTIEKKKPDWILRIIPGKDSQIWTSLAINGTPYKKIEAIGPVPPVTKKKQWSECATFNISDAFLICSLCSCSSK